MYCYFDTSIYNLEQAVHFTESEVKGRICEIATGERGGTVAAGISGSGSDPAGRERPLQQRQRRLSSQV